MNLHDVVPTERKVPRYKAQTVREARNTTLQTTQLQTIMARSEVARDEERVLTAISEKLERSFDAQRWDIVRDIGSLPDELRGDDDLTKFAMSPRSKLADIRKMADRFGFIIIPWAYFAGPEGKGADDFIETSEAGDFTVYVVSPITYYSLEKHVAAPADLSIYAGAFEQAFAGINMSIPMFRQLARRVGNLETGSVSTRVRLDSVETELKNLARRLGEIERAEERRQREAAIARAQAAQAARIAETKRFLAYDPLLIALPPDKDIHSNTVAVIGPCWGPDFDDVLAIARGYKRVPGQRKAMAKIGW